MSKIIFRSLFLVAQFFLFYQYFIKATTTDIDLLSPRQILAPTSTKVQLLTMLQSKSCVPHESTKVKVEPTIVAQQQ